jgi:hypothetical protein
MYVSHMLYCTQLSGAGTHHWLLVAPWGGLRTITSMTQSGSSSTIIVSRTDSYVLRGACFTVVVDGVVMGTLGNAKQGQYVVPTGPHHVWVATGKYMSVKLAIDLSPGGSVHTECSPCPALMVPAAVIGAVHLVRLRVIAEVPARDTVTVRFSWRRPSMRRISLSPALARGQQQN